VTRLRAVAVALLLLLLAPAAAQAGKAMETGIADDAVLLSGGPEAAAAVSEWSRLGVDVVRIHVRWVNVAPGAASVQMPSGFDPRGPDDPQYNWGALDNAMRLLGDAHIRAMLAVTGSGPLWSSREPARGNPRYLPDATKFGDFAAAVARRYGDRVSRYLVWNEPNQPSWLQPQFSCRGRRCTPVSPGLYRDLFRAAAREIRAADPGAQILIGTMSPTGHAPTSKNSVMRPLQFLRALGCVDDKKLKRVKTGACKNQSVVKADGFAYHPHPVRFSPETKATNPDNAAIADLGHFESVLDRVTRNGIVKPTSGSRFPLYLTEFGYQTNPPDRDSGVSPARQASWLQWAWFKAWADPRVRNITQYEWRDEPLKSNSAGAFASWQSGLHFADGRAKPSLAVFPVPFYVATKRGSAKATLWGQVRPGGAWTVTLEKKTGATFTSIGTLRTDATGYFSKKLTLRGKATYRFSYVEPLLDGTTHVVHSASQTVSAPR
jgi:hypothetical protein